MGLWRMSLILRSHMSCEDSQFLSSRHCTDTIIGGATHLAMVRQTMASTEREPMTVERGSGAELLVNLVRRVRSFGLSTSYESGKLPYFLYFENANYMSTQTICTSRMVRQMTTSCGTTTVVPSVPVAPPWTLDSVTRCSD